MANYAHVEDNIIQGLYDFPPQNWKSISNFNLLDDDELAKFGFVKIVKSETMEDFDPLNDYVHPPTYMISENGSVVETVKKQRKIDLEDLKIMQWQHVRVIRDTMIDDVQWLYDRYHRETRLGHSHKVEIEVIDNYVQQLADITRQQDPFNIQWPESIEG